MIKDRILIITNEENAKKVDKILNKKGPNCKALEAKKKAEDAGFTFGCGTKEHCNAWGCPHNKDGYCESCEAFTECQDNLLRLIAATKSAELYIGE